MKRLWTVGRLLTATAVVALTACGQQTSEQLVAAAKESLAKYDTKSASIHLRSALQKNASSIDARLMLGQLLLNAGDPLGAGVEAEKALELGSSPDDAVPLLAKALFAQGQYDKLIKRFLETKLPSRPRQIELETTLGSAFLAMNKLPEAEARVAALLQEQPNDPAVLLLKVRTLATASKLDEAKRLLSTVETLAPKNPDVWAVKGALLSMSDDVGELKSSLLAFAKALALQPNHFHAMASIITVNLALKDIEAAKKQLEQLNRLAPNHPQTKMFEARFALNQGDVKKAREHVQLALKYLPNDPSALHLAGDIEFRRGALIEAETLFTKALNEAPNQAASRLLLAQTHLRAGEPDKVLSTVQPLMSGPAVVAAPALSLAAQAAMIKGDAKQAESLLVRSVQLNPADQQAQVALALAQVQRGQVEKGLETLRSIAAKASDDFADLALINHFLTKKEYGAALNAVAQLQKKQPGKPLPLFLKGQVLLWSGDERAAGDAYAEALSLDPAFYPAVASLARIEVRAKKPEAAEKRFDEFLKHSPNHLNALMAKVELRAQAQAEFKELSDLLGKAIKSAPGSPVPKIALIQLQLDSVSLKDALSTAQAAVAAIPDSPELIELLGRIQMSAGDANQARSSFNKLAALQPNSPVPSMRLAELLVIQGDLQGAEQALRRALVQKPDYLPAQRALVSLALQQGQVQAARTLAKQVRQQRPKDAASDVLDGDIEFLTKNWSAAAASYRRALELAPTNEIAMRLYRTLDLAGRKAEFNALEKDWMKANPNDSTFVHFLADLAQAKGDFDQAETRYRALLTLSPRNVSALNNIAAILAKSGREGAVEMANQAVKLAPRCADCFDTLALAHASRKEFDQAVASQKAAVDLAPGRPEIRLSYAKLLLNKGDKALAKAELQKLKTEGTAFKGSGEVDALLAQL